MKTIYLLLCLFLVGILNAQEESRNDTNSYRFKTETDIFPAVFDSSNKEYKVDENPDRIFSRKNKFLKKSQNQMQRNLMQIVNIIFLEFMATEKNRRK